jgi:CRISPR-associated protein Cmr3
LKALLIEPRDPLIARDGRPFEASPNARAKTMLFPLPSTTAGTVRTRAGSNAAGIFTETSPEALETVKNWEMRGPVLVMASGTKLEFFAPAPLDALMLDENDIHPLVPLALAGNVQISLDEVAPVGTRQRFTGKPKGMPSYWRWSYFEKWLTEPGDDTGKSNDGIRKPDKIGINGPMIEYRTHVKIQPDSYAAEESMLFGTSGLEFTHITPQLVNEDKGEILRAKRLALYIETSAQNSAEHRLWSMGGERRLSRWSTSEVKHPALPDAIKQAVVKNKACRVVLLTPAFFAEGWRPTFLCQNRCNVQVMLKAAIVGRPVVVSGWDYVSNQPKATRRLAPAGSVYYLKLDGTPEAIEEWLKATWWHNISDEEQNRKDGFGLAVVGTWSGELFTPNLEQED